MSFIKNLYRPAPHFTNPSCARKRAIVVNNSSPIYSVPPQWLMVTCKTAHLYFTLDDCRGHHWRYHKDSLGLTPQGPITLAIRLFSTNTSPNTNTSSITSETETGAGGQEGCGLQEAEALLRERFGPHAKLLLRRSQPRHPRRSSHEMETEEAKDIDKEVDGEEAGEEEESVVEEEEPVAGEVGVGARQGGVDTATPPLPTPSRLSQDSAWYRASATCRLLGFPVELAAARGREVGEVVNTVLQEALESDVIFILPQPKGSASSHTTRGRGRGRGNQRWGGGNRQNQNFKTPTLSPRQMEFKAIMDELRELCVHFSRVLKFSIKSPRNMNIKKYQNNINNDNNKLQREWRCRAYVRDEWGVAPSLSFTCEASGQTANESLMRCFAMLRDRYRNELESPSVQLESVREVEAFVRSWGKTVESLCFEESNTVEKTSNQKTNRKKNVNDSSQDTTNRPIEEVKESTEVLLTNSEMETDSTQISIEEQYRSLRPTTFTAAVIVEDIQGNISVSQVKRQATPLIAYQTASSQALRSESGLTPDVTIIDQCLPPSPLIVRMRWQFDAMVHHLAKKFGKKPEEFATISIEGDNNINNNGIKDKNEDFTKKDDEIATNDKQNIFFSACFISDGSIVWQKTGSGRYRLEFDCYVQALTYLLDQYPDVGRLCFDSRGGGVLFPTSQLLEIAVLKHDNYNVVTNHRGKWNVYALLGTLTSQLIGSFYQTTYQEDRAAGEARAILTVNDGVRSNQLLIQRQSKKRGEAWRNACLDALRENFPNQYRDAILLHPDIDLSNDTMARGSKYRALPREKRVEHIGNLFSLVAAFAEEDLGWHNLRLRLRNASGDLGLPQWVAEMEAQIDGEEQRRVVAISPPYSQVKHARRVLVYQVAKKYFPKELEAYAKLNRGDAVNPDQDARNLDNAVYRAGTESFVNQVISLLEEQAPSMGPFSWVLEQHFDSTSNINYSEGNDGSVEYLLRPFNPRFYAAVYGQNGDLLISERIGDEDESAVGVLCSVLRAATNRLAGDKGEQLWTEYECHAPPPVASCRELALYMFNAFFGVSKLGVSDEAELLNNNNNSSGTVSTSASASASASSLASICEEQQVLDIDARELGGYWFVTLSISRIGGLAVARAIGTAKREGIRDVLLLACRRSFPRALQYLSAHSREVSSFAIEMCGTPIVEQLPEPVMRDIKFTIERAEQAGPPRPYTLLRRCVTRDYKNERWLRVEQIPNSGTGFQCRIYLQKHRRESKKGEVQLVGFGSALTRAQALHIASICALENLFEADLTDAVTRSPSYRDLPSLE